MYELPDKPELPDDVLQIIKQYAQPITRPDWRTIHKMVEIQFLKEITILSEYTSSYCTNIDYLYLFRFKRIKLMFRSPHQLL
jgi:hypothetical protein